MWSRYLSIIVLDKQTGELRSVLGLSVVVNSERNEAEGRSDALQAVQPKSPGRHFWLLPQQLAHPPGPGVPGVTP
jgi:hypothetical protein